MKSVLEMIKFAQMAHEGQVRKYTGEPYIVHPLRVAALSGDPAAVLHDVIEDTSVTAEDLRREFGDEVARLVEELSNPSHDPEHKNKPRAERKALDLEHARKMSPRAMLIKAADRIDNLSDMSKAGGEFLALYARESRALMEVFSPVLPSHPVLLLKEIIGEVEELSREKSGGAGDEQ
jgi:(p)ppGpp synthase/HD superfamily hydrolase